MCALLSGLYYNTIFIQHQANTKLLIAYNNVYIVVRTTKITVKSGMFTEELSEYVQIHIDSRPSRSPEVHGERVFTLSNYLKSGRVKT